MWIVGSQSIRHECNSTVCAGKCFRVWREYVAARGRRLPTVPVSPATCGQGSRPTSLYPNALRDAIGDAATTTLRFFMNSSILLMMC